MAMTKSERQRYIGLKMISGRLKRWWPTCRAVRTSSGESNISKTALFVRYAYAENRRPSDLGLTFDRCAVDMVDRMYGHINRRKEPVVVSVTPDRKRVRVAITQAFRKDLAIPESAKIADITTKDGHELAVMDWQQFSDGLDEYCYRHYIERSR